MQAPRVVIPILLAAVGYCALCVVFFVTQEQLLFGARASSALFREGYAERGDIEVFRLQDEARTAIEGWHYDGGRELAVLYFHDRDADVAECTSVIRLARDYAGSVLAISYRGHGASAGRPSMDGVIEDARALWNEALVRGYAEEGIVLHGRGFGAAVATILASEVAAGAVVLESPTRPLVQTLSDRYPYLPVRLLLRESPFWDWEKRISDVAEPVLVLEGEPDSDRSAFSGSKLSTHFSNSVYRKIAGQGAQLSLTEEPVRGIYLAHLSKVVGRRPLEVAQKPVEGPFHAVETSPSGDPRADDGRSGHMLSFTVGKKGK